MADDLPGYKFRAPDDVVSASSVQTRRANSADHRAALERQVWSVATQQFSSVATTLLMLYFSGDKLSIMSLMLCGVIVSTPLRALFSFSYTFKPFAAALSNRPALLRAQALYLIINVALLAVAAWKINQIGALPITQADWVRLLPVYVSEDPVVFIK